MHPTRSKAWERSNMSFPTRITTIPPISWSYVPRSTHKTHCLNVYEISWCLYWKCLLLLASINSDIIHMKYIIILGFHPYVKATANFGINSIFSRDWKTIQYNSLVKLWLPNSLMSWLTIGHVQCVIVCLNARTMGTLSDGQD